MVFVFTVLNELAVKTHTDTNMVMLVWKSVGERTVGGGGRGHSGDGNYTCSLTTV